MLFGFFLQHCSRSPVGDDDGKCQGYSINLCLCSIPNMAAPIIAATEQLTTDGIDTAVVNARFAKPLD
ncbi:MAG TPA: hypothetical protein VMX96_06210 [Dehalococcoidia bacterium]|nr:hypothetical protein [Dehalococcoidia bacterium]